MSFKFSAGPWNVSEGADRFGPTVRASIPLIEKMEKFKELGIDAIQFHDDDVVPDISNKSPEQIEKEAGTVKKQLDNLGLVAEFVAPRLWEDIRTVDGGFTSNDPQERKYALNRSKTAVDIAQILNCKLIGLWYAREGTHCYESKNPIESFDRLVEGLNYILEYDKSVKIFIESKPNEPVDRSFLPTIGHALAIAEKTIDSLRVGVNLETAHAVLAGLDPATEIAFALYFKKLFTVHLNDQNGLRYDQDKAFGAENLRQSFNQVKVLVENNYGSGGEFVGLDVQAMRTQKLEESYKAISNSIKIFNILEEKVRKFDYDFQKKCIDRRDYEELEFYVLELLLKS
ncbi:MAG: TIM barrel protein [Actinobacteria bacterium]|nr:TIM barrel protein [Actinomycetota bacterium]